jgi:hypothetical protein
VPGFGVITNIIDGDECGHGAPDDRSENRTRFWDSTELVRISAKFVHFGEVRNEFYALYSEISPN